MSNVKMNVLRATHPTTTAGASEFGSVVKYQGRMWMIARDNSTAHVLMVALSDGAILKVSMDAIVCPIRCCVINITE